jgi:hypothetical protein
MYAPDPAPDHRPPGPPWQPLNPVDPPIGYGSIYLSDALARLPVRGVTLLRNNKGDPNLETGTYGLVSTCGRSMRAGIVQRRASYVVFLTNHREAGRVLTGYYGIGWYAHGLLWPGVKDYALAARSSRFVDPIPCAELPEGLRRRLAGGRTLPLLTADEVTTLRSLIDARPDRTAAYLAEIDRLERINAHETGLRYVSQARRTAFDWPAASRYLGDIAAQPGLRRLVNESPTGWWRCTSCAAVFPNKALLKLCPTCGAPASLVPAEAEEVPA